MTERKILFLTGHLAWKPLKRVLETMEEGDFTWDVHNMGVQVASLMTNQLIKRRLTALNDASEIMLPGLMRGDAEELHRHFGIEVIRGPDDLRDIPQFFGAFSEPPNLDRHDCLIFAEITDAPLLGEEEFMAKAHRFKAEGADVIDVGCLPDVTFGGLEKRIQSLVAAGFTVSIDSADYDELKRGVGAGASYILSLHEKNLPQALHDGIIPRAVPILIPFPKDDDASLSRGIAWCQERELDFYADAILDPIQQGLVDSLVRYRQLRASHPDIKIFMGVGNVTELNDADSAGMVSLLIGMATEMDATAVLMVAVSPHCRRAIAEADKARRIHYYAKQQQCLPVRIDDGLMALHDKKPAWHDPEDIESMAKMVRDPNYRIMLSQWGIHIFNRDMYLVTQEVQSIFNQLQLDKDLSHAYYMGVQLARAELAWRLGKSYVQDRNLHWGVAI